jgi:hypothetical protein
MLKELLIDVGSAPIFDVHGESREDRKMRQIMGLFSRLEGGGGHGGDDEYTVNDPVEVMSSPRKPASKPPAKPRSLARCNLVLEDSDEDEAMGSATALTAVPALVQPPAVLQHQVVVRPSALSERGRGRPAKLAKTTAQEAAARVQKRIKSATTAKHSCVVPVIFFFFFLCFAGEQDDECTRTDEAASNTAA